MCDRLAPFLNNMMIDDKRKYPLTKFASTKGRKKIIKSDHNTLFAKFSIDYRNIIWKRPRKEVFNLKNPVCQAKFTEVTNNSQKLKECFLNTLSFPEKCNKFFKTFDDILHQCFRKIRVGGGGRNSEISELLKLKTQLSDHLTKVKNETEEISVRNRLQKLEEE